MRRNLIIKLSGFFIVLAFLSGCDREKAEALKIAASNFRAETVLAIDKMKALFHQSISMPEESESDAVAHISDDIETTDINAEKLDLLMKEDVIGKEQIGSMDREYEEIKKGYYQFESMFRSFPKGSFLARDSVKKAEKYSIKLTTQMLGFARRLNDEPVQFTGRRVLIIEKIREAKKIQDRAEQKKRFGDIAKEVFQLRNEERRAKQDAILQCLKAAETGKAVSDLIRDYDSLKAEDVLAMVGNAIGFVSEISGNSDIKKLLERYGALEKTIKEDPYWKAVLEEKIS